MYLMKDEILQLKKGTNIEICYKFNRPDYQKYLDRMISKGIMSIGVCPREHSVYAQVVKHEKHKIFLKIDGEIRKYSYDLFNKDGSAGVDSIFHFLVRLAD